MANITMASEFCRILFGDGDVSFRLLAEKASLKEKLSGLSEEDKKRYPGSIVKLQKGSLLEKLHQAAAYNAKGYAVYYLPALYKEGYEEGYKDILELRAFVCDLDSGLEALNNFDKAPSLIVESSSGKYQAIWKLSPFVTGEGHIDSYNEIACALALSCAGDLNAAKATQPFRMPGYMHWKESSGESGFESSIIGEEGLLCSYTFEEMNQTLRLSKKAIKAGLKAAGKSTAITSKNLSELARVDLDKLLEGGVRVSKGERHGTLLRLQTRLMHQGRSEEEIASVCEGVVGASFEGGGEFLSGGSRFGEIGKTMQDAKDYVAKDKALEEQEFQRLIGEIYHGKESEESCKGNGNKGNGNKGNGNKGYNEASETGLSDMAESSRNQEDEENTSQRLASDTLNRGPLLCLPTNGGKSKAEGPNSGGSPKVFKYDMSQGSLVVDGFSGDGICERVLQKHGNTLARIAKVSLCYNQQKKLWVEQTGTGLGEIEAKVRDCILDAVAEKGFFDSCKDSSGKVSKSKLQTARGRLLAPSNIFSIGKSILSHVKVPEYEDRDFDALEDCLHVKNGLLNMSTGILREVKACDLLLRQTSVKWNSQAMCPGFINFLSEVFSENDNPLASIKFIQELFGYSLSGSIGEAKVFCHVGLGANGKSKLLSVLRRLAGSYSNMASADSVVSKKGEFSNKSLERLGSKAEGRRVLIIDDLASQSVWNEAFVKTLTGKELVSEDKWVKARVVTNRAKFHIGLNELPSAETENLGIKRRISITKYERTFENTEKSSRAIDEMVEREIEGILVWAVEGYRMWKSNPDGLSYPKESKEAEEEWVQDNFHVENAILELFETAKIDPISKECVGTWESGEDLAKDLEKHFNASGLKGAKVGGHAIGKKISGVLKLPKENHRRIWNPKLGRKSTYYLLKLKFNRQNDLAII